jgi:hypothetical protein
MFIGYVYIWFDTKAKFFYIGGHKGQVKDRYICSNKTMLRAYKLRPETFRFRVLEYTNDVRLCEQKWLNLIDDDELMTTKNVQNGTCRYYNVKKLSTGGNGSANKGKSTIGGHNKGKPMSDNQKEKLRIAHTGKKHSPQHIENRRRSYLIGRLKNGSR